MHVADGLGKMVSGDALKIEHSSGYKRLLRSHGIFLHKCKMNENEIPITEKNIHTHQCQGLQSPLISR